MLDGLKRRQTLASFDYQWRELPEGDAMLSDPWFRENVHLVLARELLGLEPEWFRGRTVLDAGCGIGRWSVGFARLGATVLAVDASPHAVAAAERNVRALGDADARLETGVVDLLDPPAWLRERRFDVVFSFGVLHHTGDTRRALANVAPLVAPDGVLFLYLYGSRSVSLPNRLALLGFRTLLAPLPFSWKARLLPLLRPGRDVHQSFDTLSPLINDTLTHPTVDGWLRGLGFPEVVTTIPYSDLYLRARRDVSRPLPTLPPPARPYWFERWRRRPLPPGENPRPR